MIVMSLCLMIVSTVDTRYTATVVGPFADAV